jgi:hypothetical protein
MGVFRQSPRRSLSRSSSATAAAAAAAAVAESRRAAIKRSLTAAGPRGHNVLNRNVSHRQTLANALTILVGALQDFMALSGLSLAAAVREAIRVRGAEALGVGSWGQGVLGGLAGAAGRLVRWQSDAALTFLVKLVYLFVVRPYGVQVKPAAIGRIVSKGRRSLAALLRGQATDLRPLVSDLVMAMDAADAANLGRRVVAGVLDAYVYKPYSAGEGPGVMCGLCSAAACTRGAAPGPGACPPRATAANHEADRRRGMQLGVVVHRALRAVNMLLRIEFRGLTVTAALRKAVDTYTPEAAQRWVSPVGRGVLKAAPVLGFLADRLRLGAMVARQLAAFGLCIDKADLTAVLDTHAKRLSAFLARDPAVSIEPVLIDIVVRARPLGLARGILGAAVAKGSSGEFCTLCRSRYSSCAR